MSIQLVLSVWDYNSQRSGEELDNTLLYLGEGLELVNRLFTGSADIHCKIVDMGDESFAVSYERIVFIPRLGRTASGLKDHHGFLYWFDSRVGDGTVVVEAGSS